MAKNSAILKNNRRKKLIELQKEKRSELIKISKNKELSFDERLEAQIKLSEMPRNGSKVRHRNRCALSGRPRGNFRKFGLSRIAVRDLAAWGQIPGLIKSSW
ncbi:MAG: 30S ribosomal protein S14 [Rickettsiales bacterium]|nr:30S ribosomal protein S14 [Rickettsiales bacterium]